MKKDDKEVCLCRVFAPYGPESAYIGQIGDCPIHSPKKPGLKPLIDFGVKYFFFSFILAGALYFTWHWGRYYEKAHDPDITFAECQPTKDPKYLDCVLYEMEPELAGIWKAIIEELHNPTTKEQLKKEYEAWSKEKVGL